jgi:serine/threonine-protein kinase
MPESAPSASDPQLKSPDAGPGIDLSGRTLGGFRLLRRLGRGAMAEVYLAEQESLRRQIALKVLRSELATDETYVRRFHNEAQAAAALVQANIVQIYEVGCAEGVHYIAQEYVAGQNLKEYLTRHGPLDARLAVEIVRQVALALEKAAERGIVHRDIKPENIMLGRSGEVKVADFGLARLADNRGLNLTQVGITMGTPLYMSPEQVEGRAVDPRSDIYSLGVTCYHVLSGEPPFRGETALAVAVQHLNVPPPRLEQLRPDLPPGLCRIVHRMLAKKTDDRYHTARELLRDLRDLKVEGAEEGWWDRVAVEEGIDLDAPADRMLATQQLAAVMKTEALQSVQRRRRTLWLAPAALGCFALGASAAWLTREPSLLSGAHADPVARQETAQAQFFFAQLQSANQEQWLQSVEQYFPRDEFFVGRSKQELAWLYLQQNRLDEALRLFDELAARDESAEQEFRAYGLAGQSVVYAMKKDFQRAAQSLAQLNPLRGRLKDPRLNPGVLAALNSTRKLMDQKSAQGWDDWRKSLASEALE